MIMICSISLCSRHNWNLVHLGVVGGGGGGGESTLHLNQAYEVVWLTPCAPSVHIRQRSTARNQAILANERPIFFWPPAQQMFAPLRLFITNLIPGCKGLSSKFSRLKFPRTRRLVQSSIRLPPLTCCSTISPQQLLVALKVIAVHGHCPCEESLVPNTRSCQQPRARGAHGVRSP